MTSAIQAVAKDWLSDKTASWRNITAATLLFKRQLYDGLTNRYLDEQECRKAFAFFLKLLNKRLFQGQHDAKHQRAKVIATIEKTSSAGWHIHVAFERPSSFSPEQFGELLRECWGRLQWAEKVGKIECAADPGWLDYSLKKFQKSSFENYFDSIDLDSLNY